jgi:hypothetical protein
MAERARSRLQEDAPRIAPGRIRDMMPQPSSALPINLRLGGDQTARPDPLPAGCLRSGGRQDGIVAL